MTETTAAAAPTTFSSIISSILAGVDNSIFGIVMTIAGVWFPQLSQLTANDLTTVGNNFRAFLASVGTGNPWGAALADMLTADWNTVDASVQQMATDFATDVATALEQLGLIPQGKGS